MIKLIIVFSITIMSLQSIAATTVTKNNSSSFNALAALTSQEFGCQAPSANVNSTGKSHSPVPKCDQKIK